VIVAGWAAFCWFVYLWAYEHLNYYITSFSMKCGLMLSLCNLNCENWLNGERADCTWILKLRYGECCGFGPNTVMLTVSETTTPSSMARIARFSYGMLFQFVWSCLLFNMITLHITQDVNLPWILSFPWVVHWTVQMFHPLPCFRHRSQLALWL